MTQDRIDYVMARLDKMANDITILRSNVERMDMAESVTDQMILDHRAAALRLSDLLFEAKVAMGKKESK